MTARECFRCGDPLDLVAVFAPADSLWLCPTCEVYCWMADAEDEERDAA